MGLGRVEGVLILRSVCELRKIRKKSSFVAFWM